MPSIRTVRSRALAAANPSTYTSRPVPRPPSRARLPSDDVFGPSFERLHSTTTASTVARRQPQSLSLLAQAMAMAGASSGPVSTASLLRQASLTNLAFHYKEASEPAQEEQQGCGTPFRDIATACTESRSICRGQRRIQSSTWANAA